MVGFHHGSETLFVSRQPFANLGLGRFINLLSILTLQPTLGATKVSTQPQVRHAHGDAWSSTGGAAVGMSSADCAPCSRTTNLPVGVDVVVSSAQPVTRMEARISLTMLATFAASVPPAPGTSADSSCPRGTRAR